MKKLACVLLALLLAFTPVYAAAAELDDYAKQRADDALANAPESVRAYYAGEDSAQFGFTALWEILRAELGETKALFKKPAELFGLVVAISLAFALLSNFGEGRALERNPALRACVCVSVALCTVSGVIGLMQSAFAALDAGRAFVAGFVPVFAGVMASGGSVTGAALYGSALIGLSTVISETAAGILRPLVGVMAGLSVVSGTQDSGFLSLVAAIKRTVLWILGGATTLFLGLVKLQSIAAAHTDSLAFRTSRFLVSSAIPVIGASANEALATVSGSLSVIRSTTGMIGVASVCAIFLPPLLHCVLCGAALYFGSVIGELFGAPEPARAARSIKSCIDLLVALLALYFMMVVVCTAVMMNVGVNQ